MECMNSKDFFIPTILFIMDQECRGRRFHTRLTTDKQSALIDNHVKKVIQMEWMEEQMIQKNMQDVERRNELLPKALVNHQKQQDFLQQKLHS